jgi:putative ABC transport system ATP-binding protein
MTRAEVLRLERVGKVFPGTPPVAPVRDVDLVVRSGETVAVVGPSGSGKSTLLHIAAALERPTSGDVLVDGLRTSELGDRDLSALRAYRLGVVFQQFFLLETQSALDNVATGLLYRGVRRAQRRARAQVALERVGLGHRLRHRPAQLSGGERQRVAIARALISKPAVLICDEITSALDVSVQAAIVELLGQLQRDLGLSMVFVTHNLPLVRSIAQKVAVLANGSIVEYGETAEILANPQQEYTRHLISDTPSLETAVSEAQENVEQAESPTDPEPTA